MDTIIVCDEINKSNIIQGISTANTLVLKASELNTNKLAKNLKLKTEVILVDVQTSVDMSLVKLFITKKDKYREPYSSLQFERPPVTCIVNVALTEELNLSEARRFKVQFS